MAEKGFAEKTDKKAIGYCPVCAKPFRWHKNELDFSKSIGVMPMWKCTNGHDSPNQARVCTTCNIKPHESTCVYMDGSRPGYWWGMATRKAAREYITGARIENEICGYQNPDYPGYPCLKRRGHDEENELGVQHDHGWVPYHQPRKEKFPEFKQVNGLYIKQE